MMQQPPTGGGAVHPSMDQQHQQQPPPQQHNDGSSPMMMMMMMMMMDLPYQNQQPPQVPQQQPYMMSQQPQPHQQQQPPQQYSASQPQQPQPQPTTSAQEEEEEVRMIWIGDLQHWMDKVDERKDRTLWIGDLQHWMDETYIHRCFSHTGEVFTSKVIRNKKTTGGKSECYGFIEFKSHVIAETILKKFNGTPMPEVVGSNLNLRLSRDSDVTDYMLQQKTFISVKEGAKVVTDGTTTTTKGRGQCGMNCMVCSTIPIPSIGPATNKKTLGGGAPQFPKEIVNNSRWEDMLKWWSLSQLAGTCTADTVCATHRVYEIADLLKIPPKNWKENCFTPAKVAEVKELLDELQGYAGSINIANVLHSTGALHLLLSNLPCKHPGIGAKAAEVVSTMLQNNPRSQQLVMEAGGDDYLFYTLLCADDATTETNVLVAISSLFRNNIPGITAFQQRNGYEHLWYRLHTVYAGPQRKTLKLIHCLVLEHNPHCEIVTRLGYHRTMMCLASSDCAEVREAALRCLFLLTEVEGGGNSGQLVKNDDQLKQVLPELIEGISAMALKDRSPAREEIQLLDKLWSACYNKPSSLREMGLLV